VLTLEHVGDGPVDAEWFSRESLAPGATVIGPAVIREGLSTTYIGPGQRAVVGGCGEIVITKEQS
jgi:N-methylhydantoinase A